MRVTQGMMATSFMQNLSKNLSRLMRQQDMLSSGKKVSRPSDDPVAAALALRLRNSISSIEQFGKNVDNALTWMKSTEMALTNVNDILQRVRELVVQASNGTNTPEDRLKILDEITQLKEQIFQEANSSYTGRYLFSGYHTDKAPFIKDEVTGEIKLIEDLLKPVSASIIKTEGNYTINSSQIKLTKDIDSQVIPTGEYIIYVQKNGDTADISMYQIQEDGTPSLSPIASVNVPVDTEEVTLIEGFILSLKENPITDSADSGAATILLSNGQLDYDIGSNTRITVNTLGQDVFVDIFKAMEKLETALKNDDQDTLSSSLTDIDNSLNIILKYRSQIGARMNRMESTRNRLDVNSTDYQELLSNTEDVDIAEVIMNLKMEENIYRASLATGARIILPNLADFLR